jgi:hypothetical protein
VRGPASRLSVAKEAYNPTTAVAASSTKPAQFGIEVDYGKGLDSGSNAYLREGDALKVIVINRATGYLGTAPASVRRGTSGMTTVVSPSGGPLLLKLKPPNLKLTVQRDYKVAQGASAGADRSYVVGFEGSGLDTDKLITVQTPYGTKTRSSEAPCTHRRLGCWRRARFQPGAPTMQQ